MSVKSDKLLAGYRTYETLLRDAGSDPKAVEDSMPDLDSNRMRMVRQFRNYLAHVPDAGFLEPTDKMLAFLYNQISEWTMKQDVVKKHLRTPATSIFDSKTACVDAVAAMAKHKATRLVVSGPEPGSYWLCGIHDIAVSACASKKAKLADVVKLKEKPVFVRPDELVSGLDLDRVNICTADGTPVGKPMGVVKQAV